MIIGDDSIKKPNDDYELPEECDLSQLLILPRGRYKPEPMTHKGRPESLEGRWDILYRDYSEVYEEWGGIPMVPDLTEKSANAPETGAGALPESLARWRRDAAITRGACVPG